MQSIYLHASLHDNMAVHPLGLVILHRIRRNQRTEVASWFTVICKNVSCKMLIFFSFEQLFPKKTKIVLTAGLVVLNFIQ